MRVSIIAVINKMENRRIFFEVAYDGTDFAGWQIQPDKMSVQQRIENRLSELYVNQPIRIHASGRTDSGVHALAQAVTFDAPDYPRIPPGNLQTALNNSLPDSITIRTAKFAEAPDFHARYSAIGKVYTYVINRGKQLPFNTRYSWHLPKCRDLCEIRKAADILTGEHDFSSFTSSKKNIDNAVRTIYRIEIDEYEEYLCLSFVGSGFLYKMVRTLVGALVAAGSGELQAANFAEILNAEDRSKAPRSAPANGLFLMKVFYDNDSLGKWELNQLPF